MAGGGRPARATKPITRLVQNSFKALTAADKKASKLAARRLKWTISAANHHFNRANDERQRGSRVLLDSSELVTFQLAAERFYDSCPKKPRLGNLSIPNFSYPEPESQHEPVQESPTLPNQPEPEEATIQEAPSATNPNPKRSASAFQPDAIVKEFAAAFPSFPDAASFAAAHPGCFNADPEAMAKEMALSQPSPQAKCRKVAGQRGSNSKPTKRVAPGAVPDV